MPIIKLRQRLRGADAPKKSNRRKINLGLQGGGAHGAFTAQGGTADENAGIAGSIKGGNGKIGFAINGSAQRTDEYETPDGKVPNSQSNSKSGGGSLAYTGEDGFLGASYQYVVSVRRS